MFSLPEKTQGLIEELMLMEEVQAVFVLAVCAQGEGVFVRARNDAAADAMAKLGLAMIPSTAMFRA